MAYPSDLKYTKEHEWVRLSGDFAEVGITDYAQQQLGDVVYVELPDVGRTVTAGEAFGSIESVKAVSELFAPVGGAVAEVNPQLKDRPEQVNTDPHGTWMIRIRMSNFGDASWLLDNEAYEKLLGAA
jgi:glycine cleavage system H protein